MKVCKHEIEMRCIGDFELNRALERMKRSVSESVAVEFGIVDNLGDNDFRYK